MKPILKNTGSYNFRDTSKFDGIIYHYVNSKKIKKEKMYRIYDSYTSQVLDLNKTKQELLDIHIHTIKKAIEYAKRQIKEGVSEKMHIPLPELDLRYMHRVYCVAKRAVELEKKGFSSKESFKASQPFWIDQNAIITYGFRKDKDRTSKFQSFVEFPNAYRGKGNLKLNLRMSSNAYKHIDELYLDGFDLVQNKDRSYSIRHVRQSLVKQKEDSGIDKLLFIDKCLNMYTIEVDKTSSNEKGFKFYDEEHKTVNGFLHKHYRSKRTSRLLDKLNSKVSLDKYKDILHRFEMSLKARLTQEIGSDDEDNITLLLPKYHHKTANNVNSIIERLTKDLCYRKGIKLSIIIKDDTYINEMIEKHKRYCSESSEYQFDMTHIKWQEYVYALMLLKYKGFYLYIRKSRKFSVKTAICTSQKDEKVFDYERYYKLKNLEDQLIEEALTHIGTINKSNIMLIELRRLEQEKEEFEKSSNVQVSEPDEEPQDISVFI